MTIFSPTLDLTFATADRFERHLDLEARNPDEPDGDARIAVGAAPPIAAKPNYGNHRSTLVHLIPNLLRYKPSDAELETLMQSIHNVESMFTNNTIKVNSLFRDLEIPIHIWVEDTGDAYPSGVRTSKDGGIIYEAPHQFFTKVPLAFKNDIMGAMDIKGTKRIVVDTSFLTLDAAMKCYNWLTTIGGKNSPDILTIGADRVVRFISGLGGNQSYNELLTKYDSLNNLTGATELTEEDSFLKCKFFVGNKSVIGSKRACTLSLLRMLLPQTGTRFVGLTSNDTDKKALRDKYTSIGKSLYE